MVLLQIKGLNKMPKISEDGKCLLKIEKSDLDEKGNFVIPHGITNISSHAFSEVKFDLKNITFLDGLLEISDLAFYDCRFLKQFSLPTTLNSIGSRAFAGCNSIKALAFTPNLKLIKNGAFKDCENLHTVEITIELTSLASDAFSGCKNLKNIIINSDDQTQIERIQNMLSEDNFGKIVIPKSLADKAKQIMQEEISLILKQPETNPLLRNFIRQSKKSDIENETFGDINDLNRDVIGNIALQMGKDNPFYVKSLSHASQVPLPKSYKHLEEYRKALKEVFLYEIKNKIEEFQKPVVSSKSIFFHSEEDGFYSSKYSYKNQKK